MDNTAYSSYYDSVYEVFGSWDKIKETPNYEEVMGVALFGKMFGLNPGAWDMFPWGAKDLEKKDPAFLAFAKRFVRMLDLAIHMLGPDLEFIEEQMVELGQLHQKYGVMPHHFALMGQSLEHALEKILGAKTFSPKTRNAWSTVFHFMSGAMIKGASTC